METIRYIQKSKLYPAFGEAEPEKNIVLIRNDPPIIVKRSVEEHEKYHLKDKSGNGFWREIKANAYALKKHPLGFIITVLMSLQPYRIRFYINRIRGKD